jgi:hypothetical protein
MFILIDLWIDDRGLPDHGIFLSKEIAPERADILAIAMRIAKEGV